MLSKLLSTILLASNVLASAPVATDSPSAVVAMANFTSGVQGSVSFASNSNGTVEVTVDVSGFPSTGGPFPYHIHLNPISSDGNCSSAGGHLNPYNAVAGATQPQDFEVGDLAGKHGNANADPFKVTYNDDYLSLDPSDPAFIGGRSVVFHLADFTEFACANLTVVGDSASPSSAPSSSSSSNTGSSGGLYGSPSTGNSDSSSSSASSANSSSSSASGASSLVSSGFFAGLIAAGVALVI